MVGEGGVRARVRQDPARFAEVWRGARLSCVAVGLATVEPGRLAGLLGDAWRRRAPAALVRAHDAA